MRFLIFQKGVNCLKLEAILWIIVPFALLFAAQIPPIKKIVTHKYTGIAAGVLLCAFLFGVWFDYIGYDRYLGEKALEADLRSKGKDTDDIISIDHDWDFKNGGTVMYVIYKDEQALKYVYRYDRSREPKNFEFVRIMHNEK